MRDVHFIESKINNNQNYNVNPLTKVVLKSMEVFLMYIDTDITRLEFLDYF